LIGNFFLNHDFGIICIIFGMSLLGVEWMISKEYLLDLMPQLKIKEMIRHQPRNVDIFLRIMLKVHAHLYVYAFGV
jgi:hypothetical protein